MIFYAVDLHYFWQSVFIIYLNEGERGGNLLKKIYGYAVINITQLFVF